MCQAALQDCAPVDKPHTLFRASNKIIEFATRICDSHQQKHLLARKALHDRRRIAEKASKNRMAAFQGPWRQAPFPLRQYEPIIQYFPVEGLSEAEGTEILSELKTEQQGLLSYTYSYEAKVAAEKRSKQLRRLRDAGVEEDAFISADVTAVLENLVENVAWDNCPQDANLKQRCELRIHVASLRTIVVLNCHRLLA